MDDVIKLIDHLLEKNQSIDTVDFIVHHLNISKDHLLRVVNDDRFKDYFQLLHSSNKHDQSSEKLALTLDLFCCTHYAQLCKNQSCPFLHLCPYNVRPMHMKCTNKNCQYDHDILKSSHNRKIIEARGLSFIPSRTLNELTRASADPNRSFWVCNDHGKKGGCSKKSNCDKLHYCYYSLIDACTKSHCQHAINEDCVRYLRYKELIEQDDGDILQAFQKVLRQRKPDYINIVNAPHQSTSASSASASSTMFTSRDNPRKSTPDRKVRTSASSKRSTPVASATTTLSSYDDDLSTKPDCPPPLPEDNQDILLLDSYDKHEYSQIERYLSEEIGCPIKLLTSKNIFSENKESQSLNIRSQPIYYYYPTAKSIDIIRLLRWQNEQTNLIKPLIVYASARDAHDATEQNLENNQFCIFRVHLLHSGVITGTLLPQSCLQLNDPSTMCFDRMWIYIYNL